MVSPSGWSRFWHGVWVAMKVIAAIDRALWRLIFWVAVAVVVAVFVLHI